MNNINKSTIFRSKLSLFSLFIISTFLSHPVIAIDGIMASYGIGMSNILIQNKSSRGADQGALGVFWKTDYNFEHDLIGYAELEIEAYVARIKKQQTINLIAVRPVFTFWGGEEKQRSWYWQFGVGVSYLDEKELQPIKISTNAQFATIFGIGMPLDINHKHRLTLRYNHYSNGYIERPNPGIDTLSLDWHYSF